MEAFWAAGNFYVLICMAVTHMYTNGRIRRAVHLRVAHSTCVSLNKNQYRILSTDYTLKVFIR